MWTKSSLRNLMTYPTICFISDYSQCVIRACDLLKIRIPKNTLYAIFSVTNCVFVLTTWSLICDQITQNKEFFPKVIYSMIKCDWHQKKSGFSDRVEWQLIWSGKNHFLKSQVLFSKDISKLCSVANIDDSRSLVQMILSPKLKFQNVQEKSLWAAFNYYNWQHWKFSAGCWKS